MIMKPPGLGFSSRETLLRTPAQPLSSLFLPTSDERVASSFDHILLLVMFQSRKLRIASVFNSVSSYLCQNLLTSSTPSLRRTGSFLISGSPRFYTTKKAPLPEASPSDTASAANVHRVSRATLREAQAALLEYLHSTRNVQFMDAEYMSKNSPVFLEKLLRKVENEADIGRSMTRFLRYHPINEFEPFFESMGLKPSEYIPILPRELMFLSDNELLVENYHVLCNYGFSRNKIGKIYAKASEVFQYDYGVLQFKLQAYEELGLNQTSIVRIIVCSPYLLIGDVDEEFVKVLDNLKTLGFNCNWIDEHLIEDDFYDWSKILMLLFWFQKTGCSVNQLAELVSHRADLLFDDSGNMSLLLIGFFTKYGSSANQMLSIFLHFPQIPIGKFVSNLRRTILFLNEINMEIEGIGNIVLSHPVVLGSCTVKKTNSLLCNLNIGKRRLCKLIQENPELLKTWTLGTRVHPFPNSGEHDMSRKQKTQFLLRLGYEENSCKFKEALKVFRGRGGELQERFDCIVKAGVSEDDVRRMVQVSPQILNQSKDMIELKMGILVNDLGYPVSSLVTFPSYLSYTTERVKLRLSMYNWLKGHGIADSSLALSTLVACSERAFMKQYVNHHPNRIQVWKTLKENIHLRQ